MGKILPNPADIEYEAQRRADLAANEQLQRNKAAAVKGARDDERRNVQAWRERLKRSAASRNYSQAGRQKYDNDHRDGRRLAVALHKATGEVVPWPLWIPPPTPEEEQVELIGADSSET